MKQFFRSAMDALERGHRFATRDIWRIGVPGEGVPKGFIIKQIRAWILLIRGVTEEALILRASALTMATLLFIVPFLAVMFFFIQTFDLGDQVYRNMSDKMNEKIAQMITRIQGEEEVPGETGEDGAPEGEGEGEALAAAQEGEGEEVPPPEGEVLAAAQEGEGEGEAGQAPPPDSGDEGNLMLQHEIIGLLFPIFDDDSSLGNEALGENPIKLLVERAEEGATQPQALGIAGILFVFSTVFGFMRNLEVAFNQIWGVKRSRSPFRAISDYMMITLLLPFVVAGVLGITAALESPSVASFLGPFSILLRGGQFAVVCFTFSLLYFFVPNTKVLLRYALLGGVVSGSLWSLISWGYVTFQIGLAGYQPFFSTFALFPLLLAWIFASWLILLFGALLSFAYQNEQTFAMERLADGASHAYREAVAVRVVLEAARRFGQGKPGLSVAEAARAWNVPTRLLHETFDCLVAAGLVSACATEPVTYQPGRATQTMRLADVVRCVREAGHDPSSLRKDGEYLPLYQGIGANDAGMLNTSVAELAAKMDQETPPDGAAPESA